MSDVIQCPACPARLSVPAGAAGRRLRCPKCGTAVPVPPAPEPPPPPPAMMTAELLPLPDEELPEFSSAPPPGLAADPTPAPPAVPAAGARPKRKRKKKKGLLARLPAVTLDGHMRWMAPGAAVLFVGLLAAYWFVFRTSTPDPIPDDRWEAVEVPGLVKARLPGPTDTRTAKAPALDATLTAIVHNPSRTVLYSVEHFDKPLPVFERGTYEAGGLKLPGTMARDAFSDDDALESACNEVVRGLFFNAGCKELSRAKITRQGHPGRELELKVGWLKSVRVFAQIYLVRKRVVIVCAAQRGLTRDHPDVARLFDSVELPDRR